MDTIDQDPAPVKKGGGVGAIIGIVIIILLLAAGGYYIFRSEQDKTAQKESAQAQGQDVTTENLKAVGTSDATASIENDLNATDIGNSQSDLQGAESSF